jgi:hypothetical protein
MAIKSEELTSEQKKSLESLYKKYILRLILSVLLYFGFLFFANFAIIIIDTCYMHDKVFTLFTSLATAVIAIGGLHGTIEEQRDVLVKQVKEIVGHL